MAKLEIALLVGHESKEFLSKLTTQLDRLEALSEKLPAGEVEDEDVEDADEEEEDDEDFAPKKATASKKSAKSFDDDDDAEEEDDVDEDDGEDEDDEVEDAEEDADEEEDDGDDEEPPKKGHKAKAKPAAKKGKGKKLTQDDCNDAAKKLCIAWGGKTGRPKVLKFMKKHFKVETTQDLKPEQYESFVELANAELEK
jgi:hypothetical protein